MDTRKKRTVNKRRFSPTSGPFCDILRSSILPRQSFHDINQAGPSGANVSALPRHIADLRRFLLKDVPVHHYNPMAGQRRNEPVERTFGSTSKILARDTRVSSRYHPIPLPPIIGLGRHFASDNRFPPAKSQLIEYGLPPFREIPSQNGGLNGFLQLETRTMVRDLFETFDVGSRFVQEAERWFAWVESNKYVALATLRMDLTNVDVQMCLACSFGSEQFALGVLNMVLNSEYGKPGTVLCLTANPNNLVTFEELGFRSPADYPVDMVYIGEVSNAFRFPTPATTGGISSGFIQPREFGAIMTEYRNMEARSEFILDCDRWFGWAVNGQYISFAVLKSNSYSLSSTNMSIGFIPDAERYAAEIMRQICKSDSMIPAKTIRLRAFPLACQSVFEQIGFKLQPEISPGDAAPLYMGRTPQMYWPSENNRKACPDITYY